MLSSIYIIIAIILYIPIVILILKQFKKDFGKIELPTLIIILICSIMFSLVWPLLILYIVLKLSTKKLLKYLNEKL